MSNNISVTKNTITTNPYNNFINQCGKEGWRGVIKDVKESLSHLGILS